MSDQLNELWHRECIRDTLSRYCRSVNRRDLTLVCSAYHPDAVDDHGTYHDGVDGLLAWMRTRHGGIDRSMLFLGQSLIDRDGSRAHVETYCHVLSIVAADADQVRRQHIPDPGDDTGSSIRAELQSATSTSSSSGIAGGSRVARSSLKRSAGRSVHRHCRSSTGGRQHGATTRIQAGSTSTSPRGAIMELETLTCEVEQHIAMSGWTAHRSTHRTARCAKRSSG